MLYSWDDWEALKNGASGRSGGLIGVLANGAPMTRRLYVE